MHVAFLDGRLRASVIGEGEYHRSERVMWSVSLFVLFVCPIYVLFVQSK
jgi:hypothetical protein